MSLPNLKDYYIAAQIRPLLLWCNHDYYAKWKEIEMSLLDRPLQSFLGCPRATGHVDVRSQWVRLSMDVWSRLVRQFKIQKEIRILMWPSYDSDFKPAVDDRGFIRWAEIGITALCLLVQEDKFIDFQTMSDRYVLTRSDLYRYFQVRHYFDRCVKESVGNASNITQMFIRAYNSNLSRGIIGELYRHIQDLRGHTTDYVKTKWEEELGIAITSEDWLNIIYTQITTTASRQWRDFSWKNCIRFFVTPKQKSRQTKTQLECWRECGVSRAGHTHVFWECSVLKSFWDDVHGTIKNVLCFDVDFTCLSFYLGNIDPVLSICDKYLLKVFMAASKKAITRRWLCRDPPTVNQWIDIVKSIQCMECMTFSLRLQKDKGDALWEKWEDYLKRRGDNSLIT